MLNKIMNICIILIMIFSLTYAAEKPVTFSDARVMGMGNTFVAVADDKNMLFFNPAGFATYGLMKTSISETINDPTMWRPRYQNIGDLTVLSATLGMSGLSFNELLVWLNMMDKDVDDPLYKLYEMDFFKKFSKGTLTRDEIAEANTYLVQLYSYNFHPLVNLEILSYARHYFGFGLFMSSDTVIQFETVRGIYNLPNIQIKSYSDIILPIGIGIPIPNHRNWSVGVTFKYFHRLKLEINDINDLVTFSQWVLGDYINKDLDDYINQHSILDILMNGVDYTTNNINQLKIGTGYGFDLGLMYRPAFAWKFGLLLSDVYTKINWWDKSEPSRIPINARLGAAYMPRWSFLGLFSNPILALDVEDVFHQQEKNFFLKWHFGSELKFLFEFFSLRFGINEGYPSYGIGIDLGLHFFSKLPIFKLLRPSRIYFPKFNPKDRDFAKKNPLCCCLTGLLAPIFYAHVKVDLSYTGYELGMHPGQIEDYQLLARISLSYSY